jgi:hypothetical protein
MDKDTQSSYKEIQAQVIKIYQGKDLIAKSLLILGLFATGASLVFLLIQALWWVIIFLAGVVLLSGAMRRGS